MAKSEHYDSGAETYRSTQGSDGAMHVKIVGMGDVLVDSEGAPFYTDGSMALTYNGDGTVATVTVTDGTDEWVQTYTWVDGNMTNVSAWVLVV